MTTSNLAVGYFRYSSDNQNENSIEYQRHEALAYCNRKGLTLVDEYVDEAYTATNDKRPAFQRLMRDAQRNPDWRTVLVFDLSRFSRNASDAFKYKNILKDHNITLIGIKQDFGSSNEGFLMESFTHLMDDYYSRNNSQHTHAGMSTKASIGSHCGGTPPLGYNLDANKRLVINEEEAETVRLIFDMFEKDYSYNRMAKILNDAHRTTKYGSPFSKNSFDSILHQEKYTGLFSWNKARQKDSRHRHNSHAQKPLEEQVRLPNGCPQIISEEQFFRVQEKLSTRSGGKAQSKSRHHYMLSSLKILKCAECGSYMVGTARTSHGRAYTTYSCPKHRKENGACPTKELNTAELDTMIAGLLIQEAYKRGDWPDIIAQLNHDDHHRKLIDKKRGLEKAQRNVLKAIEAHYAPELAERLRAISAEKSAIENEIAAYKDIVATTSNTSHKHLCNQLGKYLKTSDDLEAKDYITSMVKEILVSNEDISIKLNIA
ncbi:MAG: recombinase family protein [Oscillospiraceae bacterium]|nr:recombinase family protein [Oscillospiraceae bacterium]